MRVKKNRENEKGAAMVTVLLVSMLLLVASTGLLLEATLNTANVTDATAEQQAYNAAESGIQSAINVLRGNVRLSGTSLLDTNFPADHPKNRINFRRAVTRDSSNLPGDPSTEATLSRWMNYNYIPSDPNGERRISLGSGSYDPLTGFAFRVTVIDPDDTGYIVGYKTEAEYYDETETNRTQRWKSFSTLPTFGTNSDKAIIRYAPPPLPSVSSIDVTSGIAITKYGKFHIVPLIPPFGTGKLVLSKDIRFRIKVTMTAPYSATRYMRGSIKSGTYNSTNPNVIMDFDSPAYELMGSIMTLANDPLRVPLNSETEISGTITQAEPFRVVLRSVGYGPRGAKKILEATIQRNFFNGLTAPSPLNLIGPSGYIFEPGNSTVVEYNGRDASTGILYPAVGTTDDDNLQDALSKLCLTCKPETTGIPSDITGELPEWLQSTYNLDAMIRALREVAKASGRYYTSGQTPDGLGNIANASGITFVDGNFRTHTNGGGILVVTGKLTLDGNFNFNGLIIVTGADGMDRHGGGKGTLEGATVIAPYNPNNLAAGFLPPKYDMRGGGNSEILYNSSSIANGMTAVSNFVLGVAEK
jgi:hypothetical protein